MTGKYWTITPTGSGEVALTLPQPNLADPDVCRYTGGAGNGWDCARDGFDSSVVWRSGITAFSDWAVGDHVGPTAISLADFTAQAAGATTPIGWITLFGLLLVAALLVAYQRK